MRIKYFLPLLLLLSSFQFANAQENSADCIILQDENSIICKYTHTRVPTEKNIVVKWIEPDNTVTRERDMVIPAFHGSVYDYRYIEGRTKGEWTFKVIDGENEYTTNFTIE